MDNLQLDEEGAITLVRGIQDLYSGLPGLVDEIFCRNIDGSEIIYASTGGGSTITKNGGNLFSGTDRAAFGAGFGEVFICAGTQKKRDGSGGLQDFGMDDPAAGPDIGEVNQVTVDILSGSWTVIEGDEIAVLGDSVQLYPDEITLHAVAERIGGEVNTTEMGGDIANYDPTQDTFMWLFQAHDATMWKKVRVEVLLDDKDNYYWKEWEVTLDAFNIGINAQSVLTCKRGEFTRHGEDQSLNWTKVVGIRVMGDALSKNYMLAGEHRFVGGPKGALNGFYQYAFRAVKNNASYQGKSVLSGSSRTVYAVNGYVNVTPVYGGGADSYLIYRRSVVVNPELSNLKQSHLDKWYLVGESSGTFEDSVSDNEALEINQVAPDTLISVKTVEDSILSIEGPDHERMLYMTFKDLLLSERFNPDCFDARFVIRVSGDSTEKNLWIKQVSQELRILATTTDFYEISGSLTDNPDGSLDVAIRKIGEAFPPVGRQYAAIDGGIYYVAKDGLRVTNGSNSQSVSPDLSELFSQKECNGIPPVLLNAFAPYPIGIAKSRIYTSLPLIDGTRRLFIYNLNTKQWRVELTDPIALGSTTDGRALAGYGGGSGNAIRTLDDSVGINGDGMSIYFQTIYDNNNQPRNRKDTFTLKLVCDTGGDDVSVLIAKDGGGFASVGTANSDGIQTHYFKMDGFTLGFRYALRLVDSGGSGLSRFKLNEYTIEYDPRPEQVNYLRIPSSNLGSSARKRFISRAFVIDSLGNSLTFTPYIDGAAKAPSTFTKNGKLTYSHFFTENTEGIDVGGIITGGVFEYYGPNEEETVSEKLPSPARYLVIPANNFGSPNRKRHSSYKFSINTRGAAVKFTPRVDGVDYSPLIFTTTEKRIVDYFFETSIDVTGIDIGGVLESLTTQEFEFYGPVIPQTLEILPDRLHSLLTPFTNFGSAAKKRIRTMPLILDPRGSDVTFLPTVDSTNYTPTTFSGNGKRTHYYFFTEDAFGVDFGGYLTNDPSGDPFEFYGYGELDQVEILPIPRKYSQFQVLRFDKIGKLFAIRIRAIFTQSGDIPFSIYNEDVPVNPIYSTPFFTGTFPVIGNRDDVYEIDLPKNVNLAVMRLTIGPTAAEFHQYDVQVRVSPSGMETNARWMSVK